MFFSDKTLNCKDCKADFLFTAGEQDFFRQKGLVNEPGRCPECRTKRKQLAQAQATAAGSGAPTGTETPAPAPPISVREVSTVICAECGRTTTVPFRPRLAKPVLCGECLQKQRAGAEVVPDPQEVIA